MLFFIEGQCEHRLAAVQNVPSLTTKFDNVSQTFVGYSMLSFSEPL